jgi:hypothetical protein
MCSQVQGVQRDVMGRGECSWCYAPWRLLMAEWSGWSEGLPAATHLAASDAPSTAEGVAVAAGAVAADGA